MNAVLITLCPLWWTAVLSHRRFFFDQQNKLLSSSLTCTACTAFYPTTRAPLLWRAGCSKCYTKVSCTCVRSWGNLILDPVCLVTASALLWELREGFKKVPIFFRRGEGRSSWTVSDLDILKNIEFCLTSFFPYMIWPCSDGWWIVASVAFR